MQEALKGLTTFVLAGGKGERLHPLTRERAKPAVPFGGIYRIIDFTLSNCINSGIRRIHVLTQYRSSSLAHHLRMGWTVFHAELNEYIDMIPPQQTMGEYGYRGTADAIYQNVRTLEREACEYVLVLAGDHVYKMNYAVMLDHHLQAGADATVGVVEVPYEESGEFGVVEVDEQGRVIGFEEKPAPGRRKEKGQRPVLASMGIYVFDRWVLLEELRHDEANGGARDFGKSILPHMVGRRNVAAYRFVKGGGVNRDAYWRDVGTVDSYYQANLDLLSEHPGLDLYDEDWPIRTYQKQLPPARMVCAEGGRNEICNSLVANGCIVSGARLVRSILSPKVRVHGDCRIQDSVLLEGVEVGRGARIRKALIDKQVRIPPGTIIGYDLEADRRRFGVTTASGVVVLSGDPFSGRKERAGRTLDQPPLPMFSETQQRVGAYGREITL